MHDCAANAFNYGIYETDFSNAGPTYVAFVDIGRCDTHVSIVSFEAAAYEDAVTCSFFFFYVGCPGQLTRTTTIPHGPLDILQAQEQVRHRGDDRRAHRGSNPGRGRNKSHG